VFGNYLKIAIRNLLRHKVYSVINIFGLAVGMAACIVILLWVRFNLSFDRFHSNAGRICQLFEHQNFPGSNPRETDCTMPAMGPALKSDYPEVEEFCRIKEVPDYLVVWNGDKGFTADNALLTDPSFLKIFDFRPVSGRLKGAMDDPNSLVLTVEFARKIFDGADPVGKTLEVCYKDQRVSLQVSAVIESPPANSSLQFDLVAPLSVKEQSSPGWLSQWGSNEPYTYLLLSPGADYKVLEKKIDRELLARYNPASDKYIGLYLLPLKQVRLRSPLTSGPSLSQLLLFAGIALVILLVACINFTNLSLARLSGRAREVGLRKTVGASRFQLICQFLVESMLQTMLALLLAIVLVELALPWLNPHLGYTLRFNYLTDWLLPVLVLPAALFVGILTGLYPSLIISSFRLTSILKGQSGPGPGRHTLRRALIVAQFTVSTVLIIGTMITVRQLDYLLHKDIGLDKEQVVCLPLNTEMSNRFESLRTELLQQPGVVAVTGQRHGLWGRMHTTTRLGFEGQVAGSFESQYLEYLLVDYDFIRFYGLKLISGRDFSRDYSSDPMHSFVINETLAQKMGWDPEAAIGKRVSINSPEPGQVIGVVKDFHFRSLNELIEPFAMVVPEPGALGLAAVRIAPGREAEVLKFLESRWRELMPERPFEYTFLDQDFNRQFETYRHSIVIVGLFSALALSIACLGLMGLIALAAEARTKEIGVRKVLGATVADILLLLSREFLLLLGLALLIAWPVAWYVMNRWLQNFAYRIDPGWDTFVLAGVIALAVAAVTVSFQALRAATADPVESLRYE